MNITAFMNLMVILVPFLLLTTVFSHLVIVELNLPTAKKSTDQSPENIPLRLEVVIRPDRIDVIGMNRKAVSYPKKQGQYNLSGLQTLMKNIKAEHPD
ncbi:MAG: biopolymer transporter ExbD, partial [Phototrophicales bacterium]